MSINRDIFYLETIEGIGFKVLFEIIEKNFPTEIVHFKVNKNGIFIFMENKKIIIDFALYGFYMNEFLFEGEDEFLFGLSQDSLKEIKKIKKKEILSLSVSTDDDSTPYRNIEISIGNKTYKKPILGIQNYINEIPEGYCNFPINLNKSRLFYSSWKKNLILTRDDGVKIELMKNTIKLSFHDTPSIIIGKSGDSKILYENIFKTELITKILKISSFGILRIYYGGVASTPLLFSTVVGCNSGNINVYVFP